jgi:hypothetical protein
VQKPRGFPEGDRKCQMSEARGRRSEVGEGRTIAGGRLHFVCRSLGCRSTHGSSARGFLHFVFACPSALARKSLSTCGLQFVRRVRKRIGIDKMKSFCRCEAVGQARISEVCARTERQNGGSFCFILCAGAVRRSAPLLGESHAESRRRKGSARLGGLLRHIAVS